MCEYLNGAQKKKTEKEDEEEMKNEFEWMLKSDKGSKKECMHVRMCVYLCMYGC